MSKTTNDFHDGTKPDTTAATTTVDTTAVTAAQTKADEAHATAVDAAGKAEEALQAVENSKARVELLTGTASLVSDKADKAHATATQAQTTAEAAQNNAMEAVVMAEKAHARVDALESVIHQAQADEDKPAEPVVHKFPVILDLRRTVVIVHGMHNAVTMTNHFNPDSGNPVIEFSTAPTQQQYNDYFIGRDNAHPDGPIAGLYEVVNGRRQRVEIVREDRVGDALFVEIAPKVGAALNKGIGDIVLTPGANGTVIVR